MNIRQVEGGGRAVENIFKTAAGETHVATLGQKYGHTQGTHAETNVISNLIPQFISSVLNLILSV